MTEDQKRELTSQAEFFRKETTARPKKEEVKTIIVTGEAKMPPPLIDGGPQFILKQVLFDGNHVLPDKELQKLAAPYLGKKITFMDLRTLSETVTTYCRASGYSLNRAYFVPQKIAGGVVHINILEAKVGKILVQGNKYFSSKVYSQAILLRKDRISDTRILSKASTR